MPSEANADWESFPNVLAMAVPTPLQLTGFAEYGKALDTARTRTHLTSHARTNIPWIRKDLRRDQDEVEKAKAKAKAKVKATPKAKAKARARAKEKERKAKAKANVAKATPPQRNLMRKDGQQNNGKNGKPDPLPSVDTQTTDQRFSPSKKENGVKSTPKPENVKVVT